MAQASVERQFYNHARPQRCCPTCGNVRPSGKSPFDFDYERGYVIEDGERVAKLTVTQMNVLQVIAEAYPNGIARDAIHRSVYGVHGNATLKTIDVHICAIRASMKASAFAIVAHSGRGYSLERIEAEVA